MSTSFAKTVVLCVASFAVCASAAPAATVKVSNGHVLYKAAPDETNSVRFDFPESGSGLLVKDAGPLTISWGCRAAPEGAVCDVDNLSVPEVRLGNGDDLVNDDRAGSDGMTVFGGSGNDRISGNSVVQDPDAGWTFYGDGGNDVISGCCGRFRAYGGTGADTISAAEVQHAIIEGGAGNDLVNYANYWNTGFEPAFDLGDGDDTLNLDTGDMENRVVDGLFYKAFDERTAKMGDGFDIVRFHGDAVAFDQANCTDCAIEWVIGTDSAFTGEGIPPGDLLLGDDGPNRMSGGLGDDTIDPRGGRDRVFGDGGADHLTTAGDGAHDIVSCGPGDDVIIVDSLDSVSDDC